MMLPNGWKKVKLGDILTAVDYGTAAKSDAIGKYPVLRMGNLENGYLVWDDLVYSSSEEEYAKYELKKGDILFNRTNSRDKVGKTSIYRGERPSIFAGYLIRLKVSNECDPYYVNYCMNSKRFAEFCKSVRTDAIGQSNINAQVLQRYDFSLPPLEEQKKIAATLSVWDSAIEKMEKLIDAKENSYTCFLASSIKTNAYVELSIFLTEVSERNKDEKIQQVLSVSNSRGFILPEEQFDRKIASENLSNYKIVRLGQYAYNPSRINVGSIARLNDWNEAVISPMYTVFEIGDQEKLDSDFLLHWLNSSEAKQRIKNSAQGSVRETVGFGDLCKIKIPRFDLKKQRKIVSVLNIMDEEISLLKQQLENYKKQKQGLMQKLLTGQWRVK